MNKKGFTVVELMATFTLISVIAFLLIRLTLSLKEIYISGDVKTVLLTKQGTMTDKIYKDLNNNKLVSINACTDNEEVISNCVNFEYDSFTKMFKIDKDKKTVTYDNYTIKLGKDGYLGDASISIFNSDDNNILKFSVPIYSKLTKGDYGLNIVHQVSNDIELDDNIVFDTKNVGVTVTFDANGGTVSKIKKHVNVGDKYGDLPIPKREGYTFLGWNGKNKINQEFLKNPDIYIEPIDIGWGNFLAYKYTLEPNKKYTLSLKNNGFQASNGWIYRIYNGEKNDYEELQRYVTSDLSKTLTTDNNGNLYIGHLYGFSSGAENRILLYLDTVNLQLEEGETATEYEPYYVKYNTKVTQDKNHTLKAIWEKRNENIIKAYKYNETSNDTKCINGEESTCVETKCYENSNKNSCKQGTIVKYKVNDNEEKYFYVLHDDGKKMTLQQRENTVRNVAWHSGSNDNSQGPDTILSELENATNGWTNVNQVEYTPGTTNFYENAYTGCTYNGGSNGNYKTSCNTNTYTMNKRTARARMITTQEASSTGCLVYRNGETYSSPLPGQNNSYNYGSCPDWMHNYLYSSSSNPYGGSYDNNVQNLENLYDHGYWTMSSSSDYNTIAWTVNLSGRLYDDYTSNKNHGARAVIEINK